ncbi:MAG: holo-ACP synthase [Elusimicrobia bacterium]|nr:holo-ACP synthase [Elusimicrobiota bacterium]
MKPSFFVGTDIVDVHRVARLIRNKKFVQRIFNPAEIRYCQNKKNSAQHFAARFAAKEAVWKALGHILNGKGISHSEIAVINNASGKPMVRFSKRLKPYENKISLSLSHTETAAIAVALYHSQ